MSGLKRVLKVTADKRLKEKLKAQAALIRKLAEALHISYDFVRGKNFSFVIGQQALNDYENWLKDNPE